MWSDNDSNSVLDSLLSLLFFSVPYFSLVSFPNEESPQEALLPREPRMSQPHMKFLTIMKLESIRIRSLYIYHINLYLISTNVPGINTRH